MLTYTPTSGSTAVVRGISVMSTAGAADTAVVEIRITTAAGAVINVGEVAFALMDTTTGYQNFFITLAAGDILEIVVTTTDADETSDLAVFAEEYYAT